MLSTWTTYKIGTSLPLEVGLNPYEIEATTWVVVVSILTNYSNNLSLNFAWSTCTVFMPTYERNANRYFKVTKM